jgi:hypothetical protein
MTLTLGDLGWPWIWLTLTIDDLETLDDPYLGWSRLWMTLTIDDLYLRWPWSWMTLTLDDLDLEWPWFWTTFPTLAPDSRSYQISLEHPTRPIMLLFIHKSSSHCWWRCQRHRASLRRRVSVYDIIVTSWTFLVNLFNPFKVAPSAI